MQDIIIRDTTADDLLALRTMHGQSWRDTYPNEAEGVSREWVEARIFATVTPNTTPPEGVTSGRWIHVDLAEQTLAVYDNYQLVFATVVASGLEPFWTRPGLFQIYQKKYPEDVYGWYLGARAKEGMDTTYQLGLAKPFYEKVIEIGDTTQNKASIKSFIIPAYRYMVAYFYNIKNQVDSAVYFNNKILEVDPTDATALKAKDALASAAKQQAEAADKASKPAAKK